MKIRIDPGRCQNTEYCIRHAPQLFSPSKGPGPTDVINASPGPEFRALALEAEALCPTGAIIVEANES